MSEAAFREKLAKITAETRQEFDKSDCLFIGEVSEKKIRILAALITSVTRARVYICRKNNDQNEIVVRNYLTTMWYISLFYGPLFGVLMCVIVYSFIVDDGLSLLDIGTLVLVLLFGLSGLLSTRWFFNHGAEGMRRLLLALFDGEDVT
ncbi:MAG: hypothetical protein AAF850_07815 [Pseudomonadota bacterium]